MRVYGIDFTSAPSRSKPITCSMCRLVDQRLTLDALCAFETLECFSNLLGCDGPWIAGVDFPFGLPRDFLRPLDWSPDWESYVAQASSLARAEFRDLARSVAAGRAPGERYAMRQVDAVAGAQSPMNVTRPPVGLMFHAGAPPLLASGATIVPMRAGDPQRTVVEAYPKLVAGALIGRRPYKDDAASAAHETRSEARARIVRALADGGLERTYGLHVEGLAGFEDELVDDASGDRLDAVLCAVQAGWAWQRRDRGFGVPAEADPVEGWIADPATA